MRYTIDSLFHNIKCIDFLTWRFYFLLLCVRGLFWIIPSKYRKGLLLIVSLLFYLLNGKRTLCIGVIVVALPFVLNRFFLIDVAIFSSMASFLSCMGLAYTTMMAIGYMADVYKRRYRHLRFFNYATFLAFFRMLFRGPLNGLTI